MNDKNVTCALDYCCYFTGFEALLNSVTLALKSQVRSYKGKELTFPSSKGIKRESSTLCKQRLSGGASDRGLGPGDLLERLFSLLFCDSPGKVKWRCTLGGCCIKERVVFQGFSHQICSVYKEKRFCSAASLPYATWSLSTQVFSFLSCASSASVRILPAKSQAFS